MGDSKMKIVNCCVLGVIDLDPVAIKVIDTPEFQRLRTITQLGCAQFVYPTATHTRFEHSIGTYHLARKLMGVLKPELEKKDQTCVQLAALCHDLGCGPFSQFWDDIFLKRKKPGSRANYKTRSAGIFQRIISCEENGVKLLLERENLAEIDIRLIKAIIQDDNSANEDQELKKRIKGKEYLVDIVYNSCADCGVATWDSLKRDSFFLGIKGDVVDIERLLRTVKACEIEGRWQLCFNRREYMSIMAIHELRYRLDRLAYQHKVTVGIQEQLFDALQLVSGKLNLLSENLDEFMRLSDSILWTIFNRAHPNLQENPPDQSVNKAVTIIRRLLWRQLYRPIASSLLPTNEEKRMAIVIKCENAPMELSQAICYLANKSLNRNELKAEDLRLIVCKFNFGKRKGNPLLFYNFVLKNGKAKMSSEREISDTVKHLAFEEYELRLYWRNEDPTNSDVPGALFNAFDYLCKNNSQFTGNEAEPMIELNISMECATSSESETLNG